MNENYYSFLSECETDDDALNCFRGILGTPGDGKKFSVSAGERMKREREKQKVQSLLDWLNQNVIDLDNTDEDSYEKIKDCLSCIRHGDIDISDIPKHYRTQGSFYICAFGYLYRLLLNGENIDERRTQTEHLLKTDMSEFPENKILQRAFSKWEDNINYLKSEGMLQV